jgi:RNA-directed DNA polymerase
MECQETTMNIAESIPAADLRAAWYRVLKIQTKLHQWASGDQGRQFADLFNLVADPAFLMIAWDRVRSNRGARSAGVDGVRPAELGLVESAFLSRLRDELKSGRSVPSRCGSG